MAGKMGQTDSRLIFTNRVGLYLGPNQKSECERSKKEREREREGERERKREREFQ